MKKLTQLLGLLLVALGTAFFVLHTKVGRQLEEQKELYSILNDTLVQYKNSEGELVSKIEVLETNKIKTFLELQTKDSAILELQKLVETNKNKLKNKGAAAIIKTETVIQETTKTEIVNVEGELPTYTSKFINRWYQMETVAKPDSTTFNFKVFSDLRLVIGEERQGFLKPKKQFGIVQDKNPHTNIKDMRVYAASTPSPHRFGIGPYFGPGLDFNSNGLQLTWQIGLGIQYNIIRF